jgi:WD40 repeat protein
MLNNQNIIYIVFSYFKPIHRLGLNSTIKNRSVLASSLRLPTIKEKIILQQPEINTCLIALPNGNLASGSNEASIRIWHLKEVDNYICTKVLEGHYSSIVSLVPFPNCDIASASNDTTVRIWKRFDEYKSVTILKGHKTVLTCLRLLRNEILASGSADYTIRLWDCNISTCIRIIQGNTDWPTSILDVGDNTMVGLNDGVLKIFDRDYQIVHSINAHGAAIWCLLVLPDGRLVTGSDDCSIMIWNVRNDCLCVKTLGLNTEVSSLTLLYDRYLAAGSYDTIRLWDMKFDFKPIACINTPGGWVRSLVPLSNGDIASSCDGSSLKIWDL